MDLSKLFFILTHVLTGVMAVLVPLVVVIRQVGLMGDEIQTFLDSTLEQLGFQEEMETFLQSRFDSFLERLKRQLPMAAPFLGGTLSDKLKGIAREEIREILPKIQSTLTEKMESEKIRVGIQEEILRNVKSRAPFLVGLGAFAGLCFGCIWILFLSF